MNRIAFLSAMTVEDVRARMRAFSDSYIRRLAANGLQSRSPRHSTHRLRLRPLETCSVRGRQSNPRRKGGWSGSVVAQTPGRRGLHGGAPAEAAAYVRELGDFTLRDAASPSSRQARPPEVGGEERSASCAD
jgi:hypothetical protein